MSESSLWDRLRKTRLVQTLVVYLAGAWVALQVVALFTNAFDWPKWVMRASIVTLAVGLVIVMAAVWAHGRSRREADAAGDPDAAQPRSGRPVIAGVVTLALVLIGAALWVIVQDRGRSFTPGDAVADAAPGIAILPFTVNDEAQARWREGMIDLLSANLDGAGGLRAIDSRTVLARWREEAGEREDVDLATALSVARSAGGRYGLIGSVVSSGERLRIVAELHDLEDGANLGQRQVEGAADSIFGLVDRLSIEVLGLVLETGREGLPRVDLARVTTSSVPALRAYLDGEALFRQGDFADAIPAYESAVEADSAFALAHYRLGEAYGWTDAISPKVAESYRTARRFADRLPPRDAELLDVSLAYTTAHDSATSRARTAVQKYPDDPNAAHLLGEVYFHLPHQAVVPPDSAARQFDRAVALDSLYTPAFIHLVDIAFRQADSVRVAELLEHEDPDSDFGESHRLAFRLAFGDSASAGAAVARLAEWAANPRTIGRVSRTLGLLSHPRFLALQQRASTALLAPGETLPPQAQMGVAFSLFASGRLSDIASMAETGVLNPAAVRQIAAMGRHLDAPLPESLAGIGGPAQADTLLVFDQVFGAMEALESGDRAGARASRSRLATIARTREEAGDSAAASQIRQMVMMIEGREAMLDGRDEEALPLLERAFHGSGNQPIAIWLADLHERAGRTERAARYLELLAPSAWVGQRLGALYEELGRRDEAIEAYAWVTQAWESADPALQPRVVEARGAIARLRGLQRG